MFMATSPDMLDYHYPMGNGWEKNRRKFVRTREAGNLMILILVAGSAAARSPEHVWTVYASGDLDDRIVRQLEILAAQDQALIRFEKGGVGPSRATPARGGLVIELRRQKSVEDLLSGLKTEAGSTSISPTLDLARQGYTVEVSYPRAAAPTRLSIVAVTWEGFHNALLRVPDLLALPASSLMDKLIPRPQAVRVEGNGASAFIADFPSFAERGIVEGFYGTPWTHQDRIDILRFEGAHAMNVYYYAPKDDPYHRKLWRDPYPPEARRRLGELVDAARTNFVDFCFAISPGLSMAYSDDQDFQALTSKLASVSQLGVSCFALFLDDVPQDLQDAHDRERYRTLAQAHSELTNRLYKHLKDQSANNRLILTPTTYTHEWGSRNYIKELGAGVDSGVPIVWTGPKVYAPAIPLEAAREWAGYIHRPPMVWDNFPVNDGARWCRYLGPLVGRDRQLPSVARGVVSNPMIQPHASMIPLQTIADYLWNSAAYDPARSEVHAVESQYGDDAPRLLAPFLKVYGTYYWEDGDFTPLFKERRRPIDTATMASRLAELNIALTRLRGQRRLEPLLSEISPAVQRTEERLREVRADPAFRHLSDGTLQWDENYEALTAYRTSQSPKLDGDFSKWAKGPVYRLDQTSQLLTGPTRWRGPKGLSARVALAWDDSFLYVGADVVDSDLYQPFFARGIQNGDTLELTLETDFRKHFLATEPTGDEYALYFSPGNFSGVKPSIFSDEDYLPTRQHPHDYMQEISTAWRKTSTGYSGDIAIPAAFFEGGKLTPGYELGLAFSVAKVFPAAQPAGADAENLERVVLRSKRDHLFRATTGNPASFPRVVLIERQP
jgi:hypothetical protein